MAYDERLAARVRDLLGKRRGMSEQKMFGGLAFMLRGNMCCGVHGDRLIVRVGPEQYAGALGLRGARPFDLTGRPLKGFVFVDPSAVRTAQSLSLWVDRGVTFAKALPAK